MKTNRNFVALGLVTMGLLLGSVVCGFAGNDFFIGDTSIYGESVAVRPNVLFLIDNSAGMRQAGSSTAYDKAITYASQGFVADTVYVRVAATGGTINYNPYIAAVGTNVACAAAKTALVDSGFYAGPLKKSDGSCTAAQGDNYYLGNLLNYLNTPSATPPYAATNAYKTGDRIGVTLANGVKLEFEAAVTLAPVETLDENGLVTTTPATVTPGSFPEPDWAKYNTCLVLRTSTKPADITQYATLGCASFVDGMPGSSDSDGVNGPDLLWRPAGDLLAMVKSVLLQVIGGAREQAKFGLMTFNSNNKGGSVVAPILEVDANAEPDSTPNSPTDYTDLITKLGAITMLGGNSQPVNELFWDAGIYYRGKTGSGNISMETIDRPETPVTSPCQKNYIILITTGVQSTLNSTTKVSIADLDGNGTKGYSDDGAKYLYEKLDAQTPFSAMAGTQRVITNVVQLLTPEVAELKRAAVGGDPFDDGPHSEAYLAANPTHNVQYGRGAYYHANDSSELTSALLEAIITAVTESDTSFVAPVVPTSPENRTYSGERIYLGFFKPIQGRPWRGNLKKFGFNSDSDIVDANDAVANTADGNFKPESQSFWSSDIDGAIVSAGGVGEKLVTRPTPRNLYTNLGGATNAPLGVSPNLFDADHITAGNLGLAIGTTYPTAADVEAERLRLINYVAGFDSYDDSPYDPDKGIVGNGNTTEKREWILGDILHSKPLLVNYKTYTFNKLNERTCEGQNETMIYVGTNDGQFHAFKDCDGSEAWSYIPWVQMASLKNLGGKRPVKHAIFNDSSAVTYIYDHDKDGNIGTVAEGEDEDTDDGSKDKVLLLLGFRRGQNYYVLLDVTNPLTPKYLWAVGSTTPGMSQLKETWSEPRIGKVRYNDGTTVKTKIVAIVGAGYDNRNEDTRYGATMTYPNTTPANFYKTSDSGSVKNSGTIQAYDLTNAPGGRGVFAIDLATIPAGGVPIVASAADPKVLWSQSFNTANADQKFMTFSFASDISPIDTNQDGFIDRLYAADTGGQLWRFSGWDAIGKAPTADSLINNWVSKRIFVAGAAGTGVYPDTKGRKAFYRPSVVPDLNGVYGLYFGTGDREHPLNTNVFDRLYAVYDRGQDSVGNIVNSADIGTIDDADLVDVTLDSTYPDLTNPFKFGWYITLDQNKGEKVLAAPLVLSKVAYFTTYTPNSGAIDPCSAGNLGTGRIYALGYKTGHASENLASAEGAPLTRADRSKVAGVGMPSGVVPRLLANGNISNLVGVGNGVTEGPSGEGITIIPVYWINW